MLTIVSKAICQPFTGHNPQSRFAPCSLHALHQLWPSSGCCSAEDDEDARSGAHRLSRYPDKHASHEVATRVRVLWKGDGASSGLREMTGPDTATFLGRGFNMPGQNQKYFPYWKEDTISRLQRQRIYLQRNYSSRFSMHRLQLVVRRVARPPA